MKILMINLIHICLFVFFVMPLKAKDKPQVFISFEFHSENNQALKELIENKIDEFKNEANEIIITSLNKYIGFVKFSQTENDEFQHLKIILINKGSKNFPAYTLNFEMAGLNDSPIKQPWEFVNQTEFMEFTDAADIIKALKCKWKAYLEDIGTQEMVSKFFKNIGFTLPDSEHYYFESSIKQAILPFHKDSLMINHLESKFLIKGNFIDNQGVTSTLHYSGTGIGEVPEGLLNNTDLNFCIRIKIENMDSGLAPLNGQVFITLYQRTSDQDIIATPSNFMNSNNN